MRWDRVAAARSTKESDWAEKQVEEEKRKSLAERTPRPPRQKWKRSCAGLRYDHEGRGRPRGE